VFLILVPFFSYSFESIDVSSVLLSIETTKQGKVSVIIPFPPELLPLNSIFLLFNGDEIITSKVKTHLLWPKNKDSSDQYIRALSVDFDATNKSKSNLKLVWRNSFFALPFGFPENDVITASFAEVWLSASSYSPMLASKKEYNLDWYGRAFNKFGEYISDPTLLKNRDSFQKPSPWLYDYPYSLYNLYLRTGKAHWKKKAHSTASQYLSLIDDKGYFSLKKNPDLKYLMPSGLLTDYIFYPNKKVLNIVKKMYKNSLYWPIAYDESIGFWTERHLANAMNIALVMWELTGENEYRVRLDDLIDGTLKRIFKLPYQNGGCVRHYHKAHEGGSDEARVCSPWMNALVVEQLWRYVAITKDEKAKKVIDLLASQVIDGGFYNGGGVHLKNYIVPYYLKFFNQSRNEKSDQWADINHACDVASMVAKGAYIRKLQNKAFGEHTIVMSKLLETCKKTMSRSRVVKIWSISPLRKFNWWFSSTTSIEWLNEQLLISK